MHSSISNVRRWLRVSREKCLWVTGVISSYLMGKPVKFDVSEFIAEVIEITNEGYKCRFCGGRFRLNVFIHHLRRKHCSQVVEAWDRVKPRALFNVPGGRTVYMKIAMQCKSCGYTRTFEIPANRGPPNIRQFIAKQYMKGALGKCPQCGRTLSFWDGTLKFVPEREVLGKTP
jgi:hypothetical protein